MARHLIATVFVDGVAYGPDSALSDEVAAQITNPAAWSVEEPDEPKDERAQLEALSKAELVALAEARDVQSHGSKAELVERLISSA